MPNAFILRNGVENYKPFLYNSNARLPEAYEVSWFKMKN